MTGGQIRAARSLIRWTAERLAEASGVGLATIKRAEASDGVVRMISANAAAVQAALEAAGVEFIPENGGGAGVRLLSQVGDWMIDLRQKKMISAMAEVGLNRFQDGRYGVSVPSPKIPDIDLEAIARSADAALEEYLAAHPGLIHQD